MTGLAAFLVQIKDLLLYFILACVFFAGLAIKEPSCAKDLFSLRGYFCLKEVNFFFEGRGVLVSRFSFYFLCLVVKEMSLFCFFMNVLILNYLLEKSAII